MNKPSALKQRTFALFVLILFIFAAIIGGMIIGIDTLSPAGEIARKIQFFALIASLSSFAYLLDSSKKRSKSNRLAKASFGASTFIIIAANISNATLYIIQGAFLQSPRLFLISALIVLIFCLANSFLRLSRALDRGIPID